MQSAPGQKFKRSWEESPGVQEFKITKQIWDKCHDKSPHIVTPYSQFICKPEDSFIGWEHPNLRRALNNTTGQGTITRMERSERVVVTYYEFFNGGSLFDWLDRHSASITEKDVRAILFQILYTLKIIYETVPSFRHNDIHLENILVRTQDVPKTGDTKYRKFAVPNRGVFVALGDFGWAHSDGAPNPRVMSGLWKNQGISAKKTVRQDLHFFLASALLNKGFTKFKETKQFLKECLGGEDLLARTTAGKLMNHRLLANNKRIKDLDAILESEYFKSFNPTWTPPRRGLIQTIAQAFSPPQEEGGAATSTMCGKTRSAKKGGVHALTVEQMIRYIKDFGTQGALSALRAFKGRKPKRAEACFILKSFKKGRDLMGMKASPQLPQAAAAKANSPTQMIKPLVRATNMTQEQLKNFISKEGTNAARDQLNGVKRTPQGPPVRAQLMKIMRSFAAGRKLTRPPAPRVPMSRAASPLKIPRGRKDDPTRRISPQRTRATLPKPGSRKTAAERRVIQALADRLYNKLSKTDSANAATRRNSSWKEASRRYTKVKRRAVQTGLISPRNNLSNQLNAIVSPKARRSPQAQARTTAAPTPRAAQRSPARQRAIPSYMNMKNYTVNTSNVFRINSKRCDTMARPEINTLLRRVGVDPATVKTKAKACLLVRAARAQSIKPYRTEKQKKANLKKFTNNLEAKRNNRLNAAAKRYQNIVNARRKQEMERLNRGSQFAMSPRAPGGRRLKLFNKVGL